MVEINMNTAVWVASLSLVLIVGYLSLISAWSRKDSAMRWATLVLFLLFIPVSTALTTEFMGWHKPYDLAWRLSGQKLWVMKTVMLPNKGIYIYVNTDGEPRSISFPWDDELAEKMQAAIEESKKNGEEGFMLMFEPSIDDNEKQFHPLPQPIAPLPKGAPPEMYQYEKGA